MVDVKKFLEQFNVTLELPFPPSINHYWRVQDKTWYITKEGMAFRYHVMSLRPPGFRMILDKIRLTLDVHAPDRRRRDLDNLCKATLDALQHAKIYKDDFQIDQLIVTRRDTCKPGKVIAHVEILDAKFNPID
jgi:crossover junction endodeoxyribonuclease RusA